MSRRTCQRCNAAMTVCIDIIASPPHCWARLRSSLPRLLPAGRRSMRGAAGYFYGDDAPNSSAEIWNGTGVDALAALPVTLATLDGEGVVVDSQETDYAS